LDNLDQHAKLIDREENARNIAAIQALIRKLESERKESLERVEAEEKKEIAKQYQAIMGCLMVNESDQGSIWETLIGALQTGNGRTCSWVLKQEKVASWLNEGGDNRFLWLQGSAGTGKSVIAAHLAKFRSLDGRIVIRHFCNDLYGSSKDYEQILKSIIRQLLERSDDITAYVYKSLILERKPLTTSTLEILIPELLSVLSGSTLRNRSIWIILDGVDTCEARSLARLLTLVEMIAMKNEGPGTTACKVLITSRCDFERKYVRKQSRVLLSEEKKHLQASIQLYAVHRLQSPYVSDRLSQLGIGPDDITDLGNQIAAKADGERIPMKQSRSILS
jgi:hypothetical protein